MYRQNINIKTKCGQHTGKALSNLEGFSPSQSHETVPLSSAKIKSLTAAAFRDKSLTKIAICNIIKKVKAGKNTHDQQHLNAEETKHTLTLSPLLLADNL
jgi:hypothetical protein